MKSVRQVAAAVCAIVLISACASVDAQQSPQNPPPPSQQPAQKPQEGQAVIKVPVTEVVIPVTVKDGRGALVPDLERNEFRVLEDNVEQRVTYFRAEATPLSIIILLDNDLKQKDGEQVQKSIDAIVAGLSPTDEAFVCRFDQQFHEGKGFTTDQDKLLVELKRTRLDTQSDAPSQGGPFNDTPKINGQQSVTGGPAIAGSTTAIKSQVTKALDDAVFSAAELLKDRGTNRDRRRIVFLISDGRNGTKYNTNSYDTTVKTLLRYGVTVYSIAVGSAYFDRKFSRLVDYAHATGGEVFFAAKQRAFEELYSRVTEEARHQYVLAYNPQGTNRAEDYHSIEVRVKREGLNVIARQGYYANGVPR